MATGDLQIETNTPKAYHFTSREILGIQKSPAMITFLMNKGIVKSEKQAGIILISVIIITLIATVYVFFGYNSTTLTVDPRVQIEEVKY